MRRRQPIPPPRRGRSPQGWIPRVRRRSLPMPSRTPARATNPLRLIDSRRRTARTLAAIVVIGVGALALSAPAALASTHVFTTTFGAASSTPANPYPLLHPSDVAIDQSSHDVYVTDTGNHRVEKFDAAGHLLLMFGKGVNKTKVGAGAPEPQQNVCVPTADECQAGATSALQPQAPSTPPPSSRSTTQRPLRGRRLRRRHTTKTASSRSSTPRGHLTPAGSSTGNNCPAFEESPASRSVPVATYLVMDAVLSKRCSDTARVGAAR